MIAAAVACAVIALVLLAEIDAWRRRTVEQLQLDERRRRAREQAWNALDAEPRPAEPAGRHRRAA